MVGELLKQIKGNHPLLSILALIIHGRTSIQQEGLLQAEKMMR
jgi:hypothetical protein